MARKEEPTLISDTTGIKDAKLVALIEERSNLKAQLQLVIIRETDLRKKLEALEKQTQAYCKHKVTEETSSYFSGSYDEVARTYYRITCNHCGKSLKTWDKAHSYYG